MVMGWSRVEAEAEAPAPILLCCGPPPFVVGTVQISMLTFGFQFGKSYRTTIVKIFAPWRIMKISAHPN